MITEPGAASAPGFFVRAIYFNFLLLASCSLYAGREPMRVPRGEERIDRGGLGS